MTDAYEKIIIAVDGSKASEKAFDRSVRTAKANNATLILTHVIDTSAFATAQAYDKSITIRAEESAEDLLSEYVEKAKEAGVEDVERMIKYGSPKMTIAKDIAEEKNADVIIIGATGLSGVEKFFLGSTSEGVARYAKCDVLIVR